MRDAFDSELPMQQPVKKLRERDIQEACVKYARSKGWWARKFSSPSQRSVPDYLFARLGVKLAVEFKAPGKISTEAQIHEQTLMVNAGWRVWRNVGHGGAQDIEDFKVRLDALTR